MHRLLGAVGVLVAVGCATAPSARSKSECAARAYEPCPAEANAQLAIERQNGRDGVESARLAYERCLDTELARCDVVFGK
jgi:hypothetical protein